MLDVRLGRWLAVDPMAAKYPSYSPYHYAGDSPISIVDKNGKEWIISYTIDEANKTATLNITVTADLLNSSTRKDINMEALKADMQKNFKEIYDGATGPFQGYTVTVNAQIDINIITTPLQNKGKRHLIEILNPSNSIFKDPNGRTYAGGAAFLGGLYVGINSNEIVNSKTPQKGLLPHEIGHTGGLIHFFEFSDEEGSVETAPDGTQLFANGKNYDVLTQEFYNQGNDINLENNFMNYPEYVVVKQPFLKYTEAGLQRDPGPVQPNQLLQIFQNYNKGALNENNIKESRMRYHK